MQALPVYTDFQTITALREGPGASGSERLEGAAQQFSAVFTHMLLKSMRQANLGDGIFDSSQSRFYRDLFDQQLALELSTREGFGFTSLLVDHLRQVTGASGQREETTDHPVRPGLSDPENAGQPPATGLAQAAAYRLVQETAAAADKVISRDVDWMGSRPGE